MIIDNFQMLLTESIVTGKLKPVNKFMNASEISNVVNNFKFKKNLFPIPILLGTKSSKNLYKNKIESLTYKNKVITKIIIEDVFKLDLKKLFQILIGKNYKNHPLYIYYKKYNYFISSRNLKNIKKSNFILKGSKIAFATRNSPHIGHKKIIKYYSNLYENLIVSITQKNNKSNYKLIKKNYEKFIKNEIPKKNIYIKDFKFPSFKMGPREALLQGITRHNIYRSDFIVGRDHSGYKKFFNENDSFNLCKKFESKLKFKFIKSYSPFYCKYCKKVNLRFECMHWKEKKYFLDISNTYLHKLKKSWSK